MLARTIYVRSVSAVVCGLIVPAIGAGGFILARAAQRLVSPIGAAIDAAADAVAELDPDRPQEDS